MQDLTPSGVLAALRESPGMADVFAALAGEESVHAVGGAVRDVLLGRRPSEVDLVVTGDATVLARRLAERLGGRLRVHERFKTATLEVGDAHLDLASTRRERYPRPGALPVVELGATLAEDLERRDFTVNAIAVSLAGGELTAHPRALEDLRAHRLRVLHAASFHDDPTRLIRLCRYSGRLELAIEESTRELLGAALEARALETVSGERTGRELRLAAAEPQPATMQVLSASGVASAILGAVPDDPHVLGAALDLCPPDGRRDVLALAAVTVGRAPAVLAERLRVLAFPREDADAVVRVAGAAAALAKALGALGEAPPSEVVARLAGERVETVALAGALSRSPRAAAAAQRYLGELRHVRALLTGYDLRRAGLRGREVGRGLDAARAVALDQPGAGRQAQLAAALAAAGRPPQPDG